MKLGFTGRYRHREIKKKITYIVGTVLARQNVLKKKRT